MMRLLTLIGVLTSSVLSAQTASEALRYSEIGVGGSARTIGIAGAIGALGGDFSCLSTNPAGLATYRRGDFMFTPALLGVRNEATIATEGNGPTKQTRTKFQLENIGAVFHKRPRNPRWSTFNLGFGYNRMANFSSRLKYQGSSQGSISDRFLEQAQGVPSGEFDPFETDLAYQTGVLIPEDGNTYSTDYDASPGAFLDKSQVVNTRGSVGELVISLAGNYDEKLSIGGTIGIPFINFTEEKSYLETDPNEGVPIFNSLLFDENLTTNGTGVNAKLGFIYKPIKPLRVGLALHSPTIYTMSDEYNNTLSYNYTLDEEVSDISQSSPIGSLDYTLQTPWRAIVSTGFVFGKRGFLSAEAEAVDYTAARFTVSSDDIEDQNYIRTVNDTIASRFKMGYNFRVGGEAVFKNLRFRAGAGFNGSPYVVDNKFQPYYTLGFGIREDNFYIDLAYRLDYREEGYRPYEVSANYFRPKVVSKITNSLLALTVGFKFGD